MLKVLLVVLLISLAIYALVRVIERRGAARRTTKPLAPDDDLDFLRDLDWQQKKDRQRRRKDGTSGPADDAGDGTPNDPDQGPGNGTQNAPQSKDGQGADAAPDGAADQTTDSAPDGATDSGGADGGASDGGGGGD